MISIHKLIFSLLQIKLFVHTTRSFHLITQCDVLQIARFDRPSSFVRRRSEDRSAMTTRSWRRNASPAPALVLLLLAMTTAALLSPAVAVRPAPAQDDPATFDLPLRSPAAGLGDEGALYPSKPRGRVPPSGPSHGSSDHPPPPPYNVQ
ncbi:hypothetical protein E2562_008401 [Oryza meyeriana var. granulata]|uniref:Uncharacterized protein n=1 Tax=Oryza meyeriana var. granulata TaxID=110450 RepID=A0A6G1EI28_9ORYZ|nr:hypothetical protein E2562_008401 [Oryza meyeriana var. granulata]